jgi:flavodoxin
MKSVVVYASHFGNTSKVAEAIGVGLRSRGQAQVLAADDVPTPQLEEADLIAIGGPTEQHGMTEPLSRFLTRLQVHPPAMVAVFDTRVRWPRWLSGSAATDVAVRLQRAGAQLIAPAESFYVKRIAGTSGPSAVEMDAGELERARAWGSALADLVESTRTATPSAGR